LLCISVCLSFAFLEDKDFYVTHGFDFLFVLARPLFSPYLSIVAQAHFFSLHKTRTSSTPTDGPRYQPHRSPCPFYLRNCFRTSFTMKSSFQIISLFAVVATAVAFAPNKAPQGEFEALFAMSGGLRLLYNST
jgi:hypothetical protein